MASMTTVGSNIPGMIYQGNIDLSKRPVVKNADGSISTVRSMSFNEDGKEILVPTVSPDGRILSENEAIDLYHKTGQNLGVFDTPDNATRYAESLHNQQADMYLPQDSQPKKGVTLNIQGKKVKVDDSFLQLSPEDQQKTVDEIAGQMGISASPPQPEAAPVQTTDKTGRLNPVDQAKAERDKYYSSGIYAGAYNPLGSIAKSLDAGASAAQAAPLMGWGDEAVAGLRSLAGNTDYATAQTQEDAKKQAMRQQNPISSIAGDIGGGLVAARGLPNVGTLPLLGRVGSAAAEAGAYGAVTGAGEAKPGDRLKGAAVGATIGAATGAVASKAADALATRIARKAADYAAPTALELKNASQGLYQAADQSGVGIAQPAADRLLSNMELAAGRINEKLRPRTAGIVEDLNALKGKPMDLQTFHELRQQIDKAASGADATDAMYLTRLRDMVNGFADNAQPNQLTGPKQGMEMFREADDLWRKRVKTQKIENLFDLADVQSETYTQSGMANAIRLKSKELYNQIVKGKEKSFTKEEVDLIRQLAKGEMSSKAMKLAAKFAPRGVVSIGSGAGLGAAVGSLFGPGVGTAIGAAVPAAVGSVTGRMVDNAAIGGLRSLQTAAATGNTPLLKAVGSNINPLLGPIGSVTASQAVRSR